VTLQIENYYPSQNDSAKATWVFKKMEVWKASQVNISAMETSRQFGGCGRGLHELGHEFTKTLESECPP
jgi:hypothetical protein